MLVHITIKVKPHTSGLAFLTGIKEEHGTIQSYKVELEPGDLPEYRAHQLEAEAEEQASQAKAAVQVPEDAVLVKQYVRAKATPVKKKKRRIQMGPTMLRMLEAFQEVNTVLSSAELQEFMSKNSSATARTCGCLCRAKYLVKLEKGLYKRIK
jgi:hypothetical protein